MDACYIVKREGASTILATTEEKDYATAFDAFLDARRQALAFSLTSLSHPVNVLYQEEHPMNVARVGFALNGEWRWRSWSR